MSRSVRALSLAAVCSIFCLVAVEAQPLSTTTMMTTTTTVSSSTETGFDVVSTISPGSLRTSTFGTPSAAAPTTSSTSSPVSSSTNKDNLSPHHYSRLTPSDTPTTTTTNTTPRPQPPNAPHYVSHPGQTPTFATAPTPVASGSCSIGYFTGTDGADAWTLDFATDLLTPEFRQGRGIEFAISITMVDGEEVRDWKCWRKEGGKGTRITFEVDLQKRGWTQHLERTKTFIEAIEKAYAGSWVMQPNCPDPFAGGL